ncbi:hypothetical protein [Thermomonas sp.]|uniref:hypothetical protein n=1 Tax=Thermomonas sp. TaxID=1971895 RepID=UPI0024876390|nr:hypothetical protein [Thermomonas sp.]MDI1254227.1 hypothetical protein [Thermomonas sp.]
MSWDPFQRDVLAELGHVVYRQAGVAMALDAEVMRIDAPGVDAAMIDNPMLAHVARAASMTTEALQERIGDMQVFAGLRGNPAAKRALWPRLRALRRQG